MTVSLETWRRDFIPTVAAYANNRNIAVNLRDGFPHPYTLSDAEAYITGCMETGDGQQLCRAVVVGGEAVGSIGVFLRDGGRAELGYWLAEPFWGRGIMTDAVRQLCALAFIRFAISSIFATPYAYNTASRRVLEKAGFQFEGFARDHTCSRGALCLYTLKEGVPQSAYAGMQFSEKERN